MADVVKRQTGTEVEQVDGDRGEFTVLVDGKVVARKDLELPPLDEVVDAVLHLASRGASYTTGACVTIDGGYTMQLRWP